MSCWRKVLSFSVGAIAVATLTLSASASQLATESQAAVPKDVQQLIVVDYQAMENSDIAMKLRAKVLPPELKRLQDALQHSGMNVNQSVVQLTFASYRVSGTFRRVLWASPPDSSRYSSSRIISRSTMSKASGAERDDLSDGEYGIERGVFGSDHDDLRFPGSD